MKYKGKSVLTMEALDFDTTYQLGDYVDEEIVNSLMNALPPRTLSENLLQVGEPYCTKFDEKNNMYRSTFSTFKRVAGQTPNEIWEFVGHCFAGEDSERGSFPSYISSYT